MSYSIYYDKQFIKVSDNQFIPMIEAGDNNVYEATNSGRKRARDWQFDRWVAPNLIASKEEILNTVEELRTRSQERSEDNAKEYSDDSWKYNDKRFGWHTSIAMYGKGTSGTSFGMFKGFYETGMKQALTIEELKEYDVNVSINTSYYSDKTIEKYGLEKKNAIQIKSTEHLIEIVNKWKEYYKDCLEVITFEITKWGLRNIKTKRSNKIRQEKRPKEYVNVNKFYVLDCIGLPGYFVKNTARGFKYSSYYSSAKKFLDEKQAKKFHEKLRNKDRFEVKYIYLGDFHTITL